MANYANLISAVQTVIKANGNNEITGALLQQSLLAMINSLGGYYQFVGIATPSINPGTPDQNVFYIGGAGTYSNFSNLVVPAGHIGVLKYNGTWTLETVQAGDVNAVKFVAQTLTNIQKAQARTNIGAASNEQVSQLEAQLTEMVQHSITECDLEITDTDGNILARFRDGGIETKNFNSEDTPETDDNEDADLSIEDEQGNVLVRFRDGGIKTKNFDSSKQESIKPLFGKTFSILGDSISTFQGYLRSDEPGYDGATYAYWYPQAYLNNVNETWWKKMGELTGMTLLQNCAWSGSQVCGNSQSTTTAQAGCSTRRITDLSKNGVAPDIIIILIGVNDLRNSDSRALGDWTGNDEIVADSSDVNTFSSAYSLMVSKIMTTYPNSEVFCCTILDTGHTGWDTHDNAKYPCMNDRGNTTKEWNDTIRMVSESLGAKVLDMHECGIDFFNLDLYTGDRLHPNSNGATLMAKQAARELLSKSKLTVK